MANVRIPITLEISEADIDLIAATVEGDAPAANKVAQFVSRVMGDISSGGMLIPGDLVEKMQNVNPDLTDPDVVVAACERASGIEDDGFVIKFPNDPAMMGEISQRAEREGITVQALITMFMETAISMGWFFDLSPETRVIFLEKPLADRVEQALGGPDWVTEDIVMAIEQRNDFIEQAAPKAEPGALAAGLPGISGIQGAAGIALPMSAPTAEDDDDEDDEEIHLEDEAEMITG